MDNNQRNRIDQDNHGEYPSTDTKSIPGARIDHRSEQSKSKSKDGEYTETNESTSFEALDGFLDGEDTENTD